MASSTRGRVGRLPRRVLAAAVVVALAVAAVPRVLDAWGAHGHRIVGGGAARALPPEMPSFFRAADRQLAYLNPEPDRWRSREERRSDPALDGATAPDHYIDIELIPAPRRAGILAAGDRFAYADSLRALGESPEKVGMLPFRMVEMTQRLRDGFRRWRRATDAEERAWIEQLIIADAGVLGHYVADASNPAHTSIHHNGWVGDNPRGFATDTRFHGRFEGEFVGARVGGREVEARIAGAAPRVMADLRAATVAYVLASHSELERLYEMDRVQRFDSTNVSDAHRQFAAERLAAGAAMLRDLWWTAWVTSADTGGPPSGAGRRATGGDS